MKISSQGTRRSDQSFWIDTAEITVKIETDGAKEKRDAPPF